MRWLAVALGLAACNQVFGLDRTRAIDAAIGPDAPPDASPDVDEDVDGILNVADNCPGIWNPD